MEFSFFLLFHQASSVLQYKLDKNFPPPPSRFSINGAELEFQINLFRAAASLYFLGRFFRLEPSHCLARVEFSRDRLFVVSVDTYNGSMMHFWRLDRRQMGAFLCIASNDVPPAVSKRIILNVNCEYTFNGFSHHNNSFKNWHGGCGKSYSNTFIVHQVI